MSKKVEGFLKDKRDSIVKELNESLKSSIENVKKSKLYKNILDGVKIDEIYEGLAEHGQEFTVYDQWLNYVKSNAKKDKTAATEFQNASKLKQKFATYYMVMEAVDKLREEKKDEYSQFIVTLENAYTLPASAIPTYLKTHFEFKDKNLPIPILELMDRVLLVDHRKLAMFGSHLSADGRFTLSKKTIPFFDNKKEKFFFVNENLFTITKEGKVIVTEDFSGVSNNFAKLCRIYHTNFVASEAMLEHKSGLVTITKETKVEDKNGIKIVTTITKAKSINEKLDVGKSLKINLDKSFGIGSENEVGTIELLKKIDTPNSKVDKFGYEYSINGKKQNGLLTQEEVDGLDKFIVEAKEDNETKSDVEFIGKNAEMLKTPKEFYHAELPELGAEIVFIIRPKDKGAVVYSDPKNGFTQTFDLESPEQVKDAESQLGIDINKLKEEIALIKTRNAQVLNEAPDDDAAVPAGEEPTEDTPPADDATAIEGEPTEDTAFPDDAIAGEETNVKEEDVKSKDNDDKITELTKSLEEIQDEIDRIENLDDEYKSDEDIQTHFLVLKGKSQILKDKILDLTQKQNQAKDIEDIILSNQEAINLLQENAIKIKNKLNAKKVYEETLKYIPTLGLSNKQKTSLFEAFKDLNEGKDNQILKLIKSLGMKKTDVNEKADLKKLGLQEFINKTINSGVLSRDLQSYFVEEITKNPNDYEKICESYGVSLDDIEKYDFSKPVHESKKKNLKKKMELIDGDYYSAKTKLYLNEDGVLSSKESKEFIVEAKELVRYMAAFGQFVNGKGNLYKIDESCLEKINFFDLKSLKEGQNFKIKINGQVETLIFEGKYMGNDLSDKYCFENSLGGSIEYDETKVMLMLTFDRIDEAIWDKNAETTIKGFVAQDGANAEKELKDVLFKKVEDLSYNAIRAMEFTLTKSGKGKFDAKIVGAKETIDAIDKWLEKTKNINESKVLNESRINEKKKLDFWQPDTVVFAKADKDKENYLTIKDGAFTYDECEQAGGDMPEKENYTESQLNSKNWYTADDGNQTIWGIFGGEYEVAKEIGLEEEFLLNEDSESKQAMVKIDIPDFGTTEVVIEFTDKDKKNFNILTFGLEGDVHVVEGDVEPEMFQKIKELTQEEVDKKNYKLYEAAKPSISLDKFRRIFQDKSIASYILRLTDGMGNKSTLVLNMKYKETVDYDSVYYGRMVLYGGWGDSGTPFSLSNLQSGHPPFSGDPDEAIVFETDDKLKAFLNGNLEKNLDKIFKEFFEKGMFDILKEWVNSGVERVTKTEFISRINFDINESTDPKNPNGGPKKPKEGYFAEWTGDNWQSVFPSKESEKSQSHSTLEDVLDYMQNECDVTEEIKISLPRIKMLSADEIKNAWKKCYGEDLSKEYSGLWNLIKNTSVPINKLISNWSTVYGENMVEKYSGFFDEIVRDEKLYESSKPNGSKLSDEDYEKLIGLAKVNSIDDLIEKGYDKSDVISASHASLKRSGIKLAKDGDRKGDDPSDKQYKDRVIKTNESISQDILVYLYANKEPLTVEKISDYIDGGKSPKSVEKELNKYVKNGHVTKEEDGYKITEKGKDLRKSWINENNGLDFSIISTDGLNFMKTALEKDPTKLTSQEICDEIGNMYDEDPGTFKVGEEQEVDGIKIVQSIGKENEKEYFFVGTNDQAKAKKVFSKSKFINESKSEETFLGNLVFYLEDEEKGATKKELISFEKITRKYINDFKYLDYLSTGGGKSTAANLVKKFKEDRLSLKDYIDELKTAFKDKLDTIKKINENSTTKSEYVVNVGNVGNVLSTTDYDEAKKTYDEYVEISNSGVGKAGNETVYLLKDGEPIKEHQGSINESKEVKDGDLKEIEKEIYDTFGLGGDQKVIHINDLIDNIVPEIYPNGKNNEELAEQVATLLTKNGWSVERPMGEAIEGKKIFKYESWKKAVEKIAKGLVDFVEKGDYENAVSTKTNKVLGYWKKDDETGLVYENKIKLMFNNKINEAKILNEFNNSYLVEVGNTQEVYTREELQNLVPGSKN